MAVLASAISLVLPEGAVVSGLTAALLHGADVRWRGDLEIDVTMLRESVIRRAGIRATAAYLEAGDVVDQRSPGHLAGATSLTSLASGT